MTTALVLMEVEPQLEPLRLEGDGLLVESAARGWEESGLTVRIVRGRKMRTLGSLFDEFAAALQFPLYFGENKDALNDCVAELAGLPAGRGFVVIITDPDQTLADESVAAHSWFVRSLASAAAELSEVVELGESWDRPAVPFHVVLAGSSTEVDQRASSTKAARFTFRLRLRSGQHYDLFRGPFMTGGLE